MRNLNLNRKFFTATALFTGGISTVVMAQDYTNIVLINLDDVGYGDFSCNGAYGYKTPNRGITNILYKSIVKHYFSKRSNYFHLSKYPKTMV